MVCPTSIASHRWRQNTADARSVSTSQPNLGMMSRILAQTAVAPVALLRAPKKCLLDGYITHPLQIARTSIQTKKGAILDTSDR
jgi:hypothetical protein